MNLKDCHNFDDFRKLAKNKLPSPIFHYIDGGADDEATLKRNTESFDECDLIPDVLTGVNKVDLNWKGNYPKKRPLNINQILIYQEKIIDYLNNNNSDIRYIDIDKVENFDLKKHTVDNMHN